MIPDSRLLVHVCHDSANILNGKGLKVSLVTTHSQQIDMATNIT